MERVARRIFWSTIAGATLAATPLAASDLVIGGGSTDMSLSDARDAPAFQFEIHEAIADGPYYIGAAIVSQTRGNGWIGFGPSFKAEISGNWFAEGSLMAGYYHADDDATADSGFSGRALFGVGYDLSDRYSISIAASHMTLRDDDATNSIALRLRGSF